MASSDATPLPIKGQAYRITFPILDADGDLVSGATGLDSEVSKDGGTFADCTNEATEIATSSGIYYLDLTSTEMNADTVSVIVKTSTSGAKTTTLILYPVENGLDIPVDARYLAGTAYASADFSTTMKASINTEADTALTDYGPLQPTTAGRKLDVSAGGEAGIDWANVGSPTTTVGLSGTTISTSQAVASVSGAVGSVTGNVGGNVTGSVGSVASYGTLVSDVATAVWAAGTRTLSSFGSLVSDIWTSFNATQFAKFFSVDSGTTYAGSVAGSVVKEIADNASGGGGGGGASQYALEGTFFRSGSTYYWIGHLRVNGSVVTSGLSSLAVVDVRGNNGATDLGYTAGTAATIGTNGTLYGSFTLTTAPTDGQPCALTVTVVYGGTTYRGRFLAAGVP